MAINIIRQSDREINVRLTQKTCDDVVEPFDLTGVTQIKAYFENEDTTILAVDMTPSGAITVVSATGGKIKIALNDTQTGALKVGEGLCFEVEVHIGTVKTIISFDEVLNVIDRCFGNQP